MTERRKYYFDITYHVKSDDLIEKLLEFYDKIRNELPDKGIHNKIESYIDTKTGDFVIEVL